MEQLTKQIPLSNNRSFEIMTQDDPESPREFDNLGTMVCWSHKYKLGDKHEFRDPDQFERDFGPLDIKLPLYLYDHSGITIATTPFSCRWDSAQTGYIYVTHERCTKDYGKGYDVDKIKEILKSEVKLYDNFLTGNVYGFYIKDKEGEIEDSCFGFYGHDLKENGILDHLNKVDRKAVEEGL